MMRKKFIIKISLISLIILLMLTTKGFCVINTDTTKIKVDGSTAWTSIEIGDSYAACEALNSASSTLGTTELRAHLTTDYDWNAMAIFSISQYGGATTNTTSPTTGGSNKSGIYNVGKNVQTTTVRDDFNGKSGACASLFENGVPKEYVNIIDPTTGIEYDINNNETGRIAISYLSDDLGTGKFFGASFLATHYRGDQVLSIKNGLFGVAFGEYLNWNTQGNGGATTSTTFWPVIWN